MYTHKKDNKLRLCSAVTSVVLATMTVSLTAPRVEAKAVENQQITGVDKQEVAAWPLLIAAAAAGGLLIAFGLGVAQGYLEAKNEQGSVGPDPLNPTGPGKDKLAKIDGEFDYVLN